MYILLQKKNKPKTFSDNDERLYCITAVAVIKGNCEAQTQSAPLPVILDELVKRGFQLALLYYFFFNQTFLRKKLYLFSFTARQNNQ